ncbi:MAG: hypothetical protein IT453_20980 [Planctomycetes bacterium]|nr:hypothetical protein [Planctomycetota bacterium]
MFTIASILLAGFGGPTEFTLAKPNPHSGPPATPELEGVAVESVANAMLESGIILSSLGHQLGDESDQVAFEIMAGALGSCSTELSDASAYVHHLAQYGLEISDLGLDALGELATQSERLAVELRAGRFGEARSACDSLQSALDSVFGFLGDPERSPASVEAWHSVTTALEHVELGVRVLAELQDSDKLVELAQFAADAVSMPADELQALSEIQQQISDDWLQAQLGLDAPEMQAALQTIDELRSAEQLISWAETAAPNARAWLESAGHLVVAGGLTELGDRMVTLVPAFSTSMTSALAAGVFCPHECEENRDCGNCSFTWGLGTVGTGPEEMHDLGNLVVGLESIAASVEILRLHPTSRMFANIAANHAYYEIITNHFVVMAPVAYIELSWQYCQKSWCFMFWDEEECEWDSSSDIELDLDLDPIDMWEDDVKSKIINAAKAKADELCTEKGY